MGSDPNACGCTSSCPPLTQLDPTIPGVSVLTGTPFITINGVASGSANGLVTVGLKGDGAVTNNQYYGKNGVGAIGFFNLPAGTVTSISTADSITGGPITGVGTIQLVNDQLAPGALAYYGTDGGGTKGWFSLPSGLASPLTTKGDIFAHSNVDARFAVGADNQIIIANSAMAIGLQWVNNSASIVSFTPVGTIPSTTVQAAIAYVEAETSKFSAKGDLLTYTGAAPATQGVGTNGQALIADSTQPNGLRWGAPARLLQTTATAVTPHLLLANEYVLEVSAAAPFTVNLSLGATYPANTLFTVKDAANNAAVNNITINASGGQTIDGAISAVININSGDLSFYWNGTKWLTLG